MKEEKIVSQVGFILCTAPIIGLIWKPLKSLLNTSHALSKSSSGEICLTGRTKDGLAD